MFKSTIVLILFICVTWSDALLISPCQECSKAKSMPMKVIVGGCDDDTCDVQISEDYDLYVEFNVTKEVLSLKQSIQTKFMGMCIPYMGYDGITADKSIMNDDCSMVSSFPLVPNQTYIYGTKFSIPVAASILKHRIIPIYFMLNDQKGDGLFCFSFNININ